MDRVYHSSEIQGLRNILPRESTHGCNWVYATKDLAMSALFLATLGGDFTCCVGRDKITGKAYLCERFQGAFDLRYSGKKGSIYILSKEYFLENQTRWSEEVVSPQPVPVLEERVVDNANKFILNLESSGDLIIKYYPERIDGIPEDDQDLVERAIHWSRNSGEGRIIEAIKKYHPHLLNRVLEGL